MRALRFLRGVAMSSEIAFALEERGYGAAEQEEGWRLLRASYPYSRGFRARETERSELEIQAWAETEYRILKAAVTRRHPAVAEVLFAELRPGTKERMRAVAQVLHLLEGLDQLEHGLPAASVDAPAVLALVAQRGLTPSKRNKLRAAIQQPLPAPQPDVELREKLRVAAREAGLKAQLELYAFLSEWSEVARVAIGRRDLLVRLGLASRQRKPKLAA